MRLGSLGLTAAVLALVDTLRVWAWTVDPTPHVQSLLPVLVLTLVWGYVELVSASEPGGNSRIIGVHRTIVTVFGLYLVGRTCLSIAFDLGLLPLTSVPAAQRAAGAGFGALMVAFGNYLPKIVSPWILGCAVLALAVKFTSVVTRSGAPRADRRA